MLPLPEEEARPQGVQTGCALGVQTGCAVDGATILEDPLVVDGEEMEGQDVDPPGPLVEELSRPGVT